MTLDEEWEALAVIMKLQGLFWNDVYMYTHASSGPLFDLYKKEGIEFTERELDMNIKDAFFYEKRDRQMERDRVLMARLALTR